MQDLKDVQEAHLKRQLDQVSQGRPTKESTELDEARVKGEVHASIEVYVCSFTPPMRGYVTVPEWSAQSHRPR